MCLYWVSFWWSRESWRSTAYEASDGGIPGTTELSQLLIVKEIMHALRHTRDEERDDDDEGPELLPCEVFDVIVGSGTGGYGCTLRFVTLCFDS